MRILLTNDDGVDAPGLAALYDAVADLGEITIAAPLTHQSASGHAITLKQALSVQRRSLATRPHVGAIAIDGKPADCVRLAVRKLLPQPPQLVLSGINAGANVGINVFYSGTVAAAAEAAIMTLPAIALSLQLNDAPPDFPRATAIAREVVELLMASALAPGELINVNIPAAPMRPRGISVVTQSTSGIEDIYDLHRPDQPAESYLLADDYNFLETDNDVAALAQGFVTVTPLRIDMTDHAKLDPLADAIGEHAFTDYPPGSPST